MKQDILVQSYCRISSSALARIGDNLVEEKIRDLARHLAEFIIRNPEFVTKSTASNGDLILDARLYVLTVDGYSALVSKLKSELMRYEIPVFGGITEIPRE